MSKLLIGFSISFVVVVFTIALLCADLARKMNEDFK